MRERPGIRDADCRPATMSCEQIGFELTSSTGKERKRGVEEGQRGEKGSR